MSPPFNILYFLRKCNFHRKRCVRFKISFLQVYENRKGIFQTQGLNCVVDLNVVDLCLHTSYRNKFKNSSIYKYILPTCLFLAQKSANTHKSSEYERFYPGSPYSVGSVSTFSLAQHLPKAFFTSAFNFKCASKPFRKYLIFSNLSCVQYTRSIR